MSHSEPNPKQAIALFDGMNLFNSVKTLYGYSYPNFDPLKLAKAITAREGWQLSKVCFYTGVPEAKHDPSRSGFWVNKFRELRRQSVETFQGHVRYHFNQVRLADGTTHTVKFGYEKGVDVQLAIDALTKTRIEGYDVVLIFSQDNDLKGVAKAIRELAKEEKRWIKIASAFPSAPGVAKKHQRGIEGTDWIRFDQALYDACIDPKDYRPKRLS